MIEDNEEPKRKNKYEILCLFVGYCLRKEARGRGDKSSPKKLKSEGKWKARNEREKKGSRKFRLENVEE